MADGASGVVAALEALDAAFARRDLQAILDLCAEDVVFIGSGEGEEATGREGVAAMLSSLGPRAEGTEFSLEWESVDAQVFGDLALLVAVGNGTLVTPRRQATTRYRLTGVLVRDGDQWRWRVHHGSEPAAW